MKNSIRTGVALVAATAFIAGCGGGNNNDNGGSGSADNAAPVATTSVGMKNIAFDPKDITVKVGDTITWTNHDSVQHDVKADSGADFSSSTFGENGTYKFKATKAGEITYECTLHPGMDGTITVTK